MTAPIVLIGIPALLLLVVALPGVRIAKESERGVDGGPLASWPPFQQAEELMSDARLQRHTIRYKQFISAAQECQRSSTESIRRRGDAWAAANPLAGGAPGAAPS